jgi:putative transposase
MQYKSYKIRLEPNNKQETLFNKHAGVARHAYNVGLAYSNDYYELNKKTPSAIDLHKWLVATIKKDNPWYYEVSKCAPQKALIDLEAAFKNFYRLQKKNSYKLKDKKGRLQGLPKFKKKGVRDKFYLEGKVRIENNKIKLPRIGWVKLSENISATAIKNCTVSRVANEWFVSFKTEYTPTTTPKKFKSVGVDLGVKTLATLSNGETFQNLTPYKKAKSKLRKQQKEVSRRFVRGAKNQSNNYKKSVLKLAKTHAKVANVRKDSLHKLTTYLSKNFETVVIEDLKPKNMAKNHNLASAILDGGFFEFKRQLLYKKQWYGGSIIIANTFFPSSKLCSCCGNKKEKLKLSEREYTCYNCAVTLDRDLNASVNLNNLAVSFTATAFGDESTGSFELQLVDELGIKHQMFTFV